MASLGNTPSKHLQHLRHSTEPTKKTKKDKTFTTTFTPHQQPIIHTHGTKVRQNLDETRGAVSLVVDDGSVYLFVSETDHTHTCGEGHLEHTDELASFLLLCGTLCQWLLF